MITNILAKTGDKVRVKNIGTGVILRIRFDADCAEIYTIKLDRADVTQDGLFYARHFELEWL